MGLVLMSKRELNRIDVLARLDGRRLIGRRLHARILRNQRTEAKIACNVPNWMAWLGMPATVRIVRFAKYKRTTVRLFMHQRG